MEFKVKNLKEIDWDGVYPAEDTILWNKLRLKFSDLVGHYPGAGSPVLVTESGEKRYFDTLNQIEVKFYSFSDDFLGDQSEGQIEFLLPVNWNDSQIENWFEQYKIDRAEQEDVRREMLSVKN